MGTIYEIVVYSLCMICVFSTIYTAGDNSFDIDYEGQARPHIKTVGRYSDGSRCKCPPCMTGKDCSENFGPKQPKFNTKFTFVEVNTEHHRHGVPLPYNHTTYPADEQCPCGAFEYTISSVENVLEPDNPNRLGLFKINRRTGRIRLAEDRAVDIGPSDLYRLTVTARNLITNTSDQTTISVAREKHEGDNLYSFSAGNGYEDKYESEPHSIHKRSTVIPSDVNFTLTQTNTVSEIRVGSRVTFQLDILFPASTTDISVELFTPDNETTVMILCDVEIAMIGANLGTTLDGTPQYLAKNGWDANTMPDMAILNFGQVTNNGSDIVDTDASTIRILYAGVMIENSLTQNDTYWVSAGAEYNNAHNIFVGQASFEAIVDGNQDVALDPEFNVTMPTSLALGSSHVVNVDMYIPYPSRSYIFKVLTPADTIGVMSICKIWFEGLGQNFGCGNDQSAITSETQADPQAAGNTLGVTTFGTLLNKASRDDPVSSIVVQDNKVALSFVLHMFPDNTKVGQVLSVGLSLEMDSNTILIGSSNFTVDSEVTTGLTDPVFVSVTSSLNSTLGDATIGLPFSLTYELQVPPPITADVASQYILEILAPFDVTPIFSVCSLKVTYVGDDLSCIKTDDLETEYSSRVADGTGIEADRAGLDLGHVINMQRSNVIDDDKIRIEAVLMPLASHSSAVVSSTHTVSLGVQVGLNSVTLTDTAVTIAYPGAIEIITNASAPDFTMAFYNTNNTVPVTGSTKVIVGMTTTRNTTYDEMDIEILMPTGPEYSYFHLCRAEIVTNGKNMPCMTPEWYNPLMQYTSQFDNREKDKSKLTLGNMCNYEFEDDAAQDVTTFAFYLKVLNRPDLLHMTSKWLSMGLQYSSLHLWVGQLKLYATTGTPITPKNDTYILVTRNTSTADPTPPGHTVSYSLMVKIARGDTVHLQVKATAQTEGAHICTVRVIAAGSNLPCMADEVVSRTYTDWPSGSGRKEVDMDAGIVTNFGSSDEDMTPNNYFDIDTAIIEVLVRSNPDIPAGTHNVDIAVYTDTHRSLVSSNQRTDFVTTDVIPPDTSVPDPVNVTFAVGEITGTDNTTNIAIGETKRLVLSAAIPEGSNYDLEFTFIIPSGSVGKLEFCDAAIVTVGDNLPCIDMLMEADISSSDGVYNDSTSFNLGYTCNSPLRPDDLDANTVVFEAYIKVLPNDEPVVDDVLTVTATIRTFDTTVSVDSIDLTVTDPSLFTDRAMSLDGVTNETMLSLDTPSPFTLGIGENATIMATVTVPRYSVSRFLFDIDLPTGDSACLTVNDIRIIGSVGRNVLCVTPDDPSKGIEYTPAFNSSFGSSQHDYAFLDLGIVTNTGLTHRRNTFVSGDDDVQIEFDLQMADCDLNDNDTVHQISIGHKVGNRILISEQPVRVFRDSNEKPDIDFVMKRGAGSSSTLLQLEGSVFHSNTSTAEGKDTSIFAIFPAYQVAPLSLLTSSNQSCILTPLPQNPAFLEIYCANFFFTDLFTFTAEIQLNTSVHLSVGFSGEDSVAQGWVGTYYVSRYVTYSSEDWFPYPISGQTEMPFSVDGGIDQSGMSALGLEDSGVVSDCQISSSSGNLALATNARLNCGAAWVPFVRNSAFASSRYLLVYFGNMHTFLKMAVQQIAGNLDKVTEVTVDYTDDGASWFGQETVSLGSTPSDLENVTLSGRKARGIRVVLTNDTAGGVKADVGVSFEFYGSQISNTVTQADACNTLANFEPTVPALYPAFGPRSFVVDTSNNNVFVCDRMLDSTIYSGNCKTSPNLGSSWEELHPRIECMIGFEPTNNRLYAYDQDKKIMMREDSGPWQNVPYTILEEDMLKMTWTNAIIVPEEATAELDRPTPHSSYRIGNWGVTFAGVYESNVIKMRWTAP